MGGAARGPRYVAAVMAIAGLGALAPMLPAAAASGRQGAVADGSARGSFTSTLIHRLRAGGFLVSQGYPMLYAKDPARTCRDYTYPALKTCIAANPAAPYVVTVVKSWPHEYVNKSLVNAFGKVRPGYSPTYRMDPRDAIVLYGTMPPPGAYMGEQTWQWSQAGHWTAADYLRWAADPLRPWPMVYMFSTLPPDHPKADRTLSFSAIGDPINNVVMQRKSGYSFGKKRYFIITPSATTDRAVRRALQAQGVPGSDIFTQQIPARDRLGQIGPLGMGKGAIDFNTWFRYLMPGDLHAAAQWRSRLPLTVLRVRAPASLGPVRRYGMMQAAKRTARSEAYLAGDMRNLVSAVCQRVSSVTGLQSTDCKRQPPPVSSLLLDSVSEFGMTGPYCRQISANCDGDNPDTTFFWSRPLPLDSGQVYALVDTLATQTGNASFMGLGVVDAASFYAPANLPNFVLQGSADSYAGTVPHAGKFFVHYFTRHCAVLSGLLGSNLARDCTEITDTMVPPRGDSTALGHSYLRGRWIALIRDYLAPGTARGPDAAKLLKPRMLEFTRP